MLRAIILSLVLFLALGMVIPMATEYAEATSVQQTKRKYKKKRRASKYKRQKRYRRSVRRCSMRKYRKAPSCIRFNRWNKRYKKSKRYRRYKASKRYRSKRRYSKKRRYTAKRRTVRKKRARKHSAKWWRAYRARKARSKAIAKRKRALRLRRIRLAKKRKASKSRRVRQNRSASRRTAVAKKAAVLPTGDAAPLGWIQNEASNSEMRFNVDGGSGSASLTVLGPAAGESSSGWRKDTVGGVSTTTLRRTVIDKMIRENGWVENDYQKDIGGKKVYVVVAKSQNGGDQVESRTFYFTEANGRIYSLATKARKEDAEKIVKQSEKVIESLQAKEKRVQQAKNQ